MHCIERLHHTECVAADITEHIRFDLLKRIEDISMCAAGTEHRRTGHHLDADRMEFRLLTVQNFSLPQTLFNDVRIQLAFNREELFTLTRDARNFDLFFIVWFQLFDDEQFVNRSGKLTD